MKKIFCLLALVTISLALMASQQQGEEEKMAVKVKNSETVTGVVIVHVQKGVRSLDLQCNEGTFNCAALATGSYLMVQLPKNRGMYDCQNVEMYRGDPEKPEEAEKVGAYCLVEN